MPALTSSRRIGFIAAVLLAATITPAAALAAAAIGHASVTILPSAAAVRETAPIELDSVGNRISTRPGIITLTGAPNLAVAISITGNDTTSPTGEPLQLAAFTHNGGREPTLNGNGQLTLAIATTVKKGAAPPHGAYSGKATPSSSTTEHTEGNRLPAPCRQDTRPRSGRSAVVPLVIFGGKAERLLLAAAA